MICAYTFLDRTRLDFMFVFKIAKILFLAASAAKFENVTLLRVRGCISGGFGPFFGCSTPSKRGDSVHKNSVNSGQRRCHSVEPRALTCPDLSAWSPPQKYILKSIVVV